MKLITCPVCGKLISDMAQCCPNCGYPIAATNANRTTKECPNCSAIMDIAKEACDNCGYDFIKKQKYYGSFDESEYEIATKKEREKADKDKKILIGVAVIIAIAFITIVAIIRNTSPIVGRWQVQNRNIEEMGVVQYEFTRNGYFKSYFGTDKDHMYSSGVKSKFDVTNTTITIHDKEEGDISSEYRIDGNKLYWGEFTCIRIAN